MAQRLDELTFKTVVASTPLVSMDLIVRNKRDQVLLGLRTNRPAQGFWFVPGGRICKDETFEQAFVRLTEMELGQPHKHVFLALTSTCTMTTFPARNSLPITWC